MPDLKHIHFIVESDSSINNAWNWLESTTVKSISRNCAAIDVHMGIDNMVKAIAKRICLGHYSVFDQIIETCSASITRCTNVGYHHRYNHFPFACLMKAR